MSVPGALLLTGLVMAVASFVFALVSDATYPKRRADRWARAGTIAFTISIILIIFAIWADVIL